MYKVYWIYETAIGDSTNISIRTFGGENKEFYIMLGKFVSKYFNYISDIDEPVKLSDGNLVVIIRMNKRMDINFENSGYVKIDK